MNLEQRKFLIKVIDGYKFAYKATKNEGYKVVLDKLENMLKLELYDDNVIQLKKVA